MGGNQYQAEGYQAHHEPLAETDAFAKQQPFEQHGEGRKAGKAERGNGDARDLHRMEEGQPVTTQQQTGTHQHPQLPDRGSLLAGPQPSEGGQAEDRKQGPAKDNHQRGGQRQFAEDPGQPESQGADMQSQQGLARGHGSSKAGKTSKRKDATVAARKKI